MIPLSYALLGLLARAPRTGYDLLQLMEEPVGFFWHARRSQIYPELARLEAKGLVRHAVVEQQGRPDKKVYEPTAAGLEALREWAATPMTPPADRDVFMLQVYSLWLAAPEQALEVIRASEQRHMSRLERYEAIRRRMEQDWEPAARRMDSPKFAAYATLRRGIDYEQSYLTWCRWLAEVIDAQEPQRESAPPARRPDERNA